MVRSTTTFIKGDLVKEALTKGCEKVADVVSTTFGPFGKNVAITKLYNDPHVTKDGVTVVFDINLPDQSEDVACQSIKQAARKTAEIAGDGTTSTSLLTAYLTKYALEYLKDNPAETTNLKYQFIDLSKTLIERLDAKKTMLDNTDFVNMFNIAMVASNGDSEMSNMICDIFSKIGKDGVVAMHDSKAYDTRIETTEGIKLERSYISPVLDKSKGVQRYENPLILCTDLDITTTNEAIHLLKIVETVGRPMLVICNDLTSSALQVIAHSKSTLNIPIEFIRAPFIADARKEAVIDLATVTGCAEILKEKGWTIENINVDNLGSADMFEISLKETNILGRHGNKNAIQERIDHYNYKIQEDTDGLIENYKKRLAYFTSGASVIYVGGTNETEIKEKKDRFDDTIKAVKSALNEGYVPGCMQSYNLITEKLTDASKNIYNKSLKEMINVFYSNGDINPNENIVTKDIIDPYLVVKSTIINAIGAAIMLFTTDCIIIKHDPA